MNSQYSCWRNIKRSWGSLTQYWNASAYHKKFHLILSIYFIYHKILDTNKIPHFVKTFYFPAIIQQVKYTSHRHLHTIYVNFFTNKIFIKIQKKKMYNTESKKKMRRVRKIPRRILFTHLHMFFVREKAQMKKYK